MPLAWSDMEPRLTAAITPAGTPITSAMRMLRNASSSVIGMRSTIVAPTLRPVRCETPKSPWTACPSQLAYWTGSGLSSPNFAVISAMACGLRSSPASVSAGLPGSACSPANTMTLAAKMTISAAPARRSRKLRTALRPGREPGLLEPQQAVAELLDPRDLLRHAREVMVVVEVDQRVRGQQHLRRLRVHLLAPALVERRAGLVEQRVELRVGVAGVVLRAGLGDELLDVAVGVDAPRPPDLERVEVAGVRLVERGRELGRLQLHREAGVLGHRLDDLAEPQRDGVGVEHEADRDRRLHTALGDELLRLRDVAGRALDGLVEVRADGGDRPASRGVRPLEDDLVDRVAVQREAERLPQLRVFGEWRADVLHRLAQPVLVADVDGQPLVAQRRDVEHREVRVGLDGLGRARVEALGAVDVAGAQFRRARGGLVDDLVDEPVELDLRGVVVVRRLLQDDLVALRTTHELERADAHRVARELVAELLELRRRHDHPRAIGELGGQRRVRLRELQLHRVRVHDLHRLDRLELAGAARRLERAVPVERRLDRVGVE